MQSTRLSAFFVALMIVGAACTSNSTGSAGRGGALGSGGTSSAGGSTSSGGSGGAPGEGGKPGTGGAESTGGKPGAGGARATGGAQGAGGSVGTGGASTDDAGRDVPAQDDAPPADTASPRDAQGSASDGPRVETQGSEVIRPRQINTRGFTFDVLESGSAGEPVLLLHGFPDTSLEWTALMPVLSANGYHCLAPDQRGYSPGARPTEVDAYKYEELVADAFAIGSELGERFHVVAHDWGANIAWLMLQKDPSRIASW